MHPIICQIGPFTVYSYGLALAAAFAVSSFLAVRQARKQNINPQAIFNFAFLVFVCGIIGARLFYIVENAGYYFKSPAEIIMLQRGGLSWFGGLFAGIISGAIYLKNKKLPVYKVLDLIAPFAALAQGLGRIGCLLNGCCFGKTVIPLQIYSSFFLILIFWFLRFLQERPHKPGEIFFAYLFLYSLKRFLIEFWRADHTAILFGLTLFQIIALAIFCVSSLKIINLKKRKSF